MAATDITEIDAEKLMRMLSLHVNFLLFDTRSLEEYNKGHIRGAHHVPAKSVDLFVAELSKMIPQKDTPVVIYDNDGVASAELVFSAESHGFINIVNLEGGYTSYVAAAGPGPGSNTDTDSGT
jgi:rhodanese-related sulfurtransferase